MDALPISDARSREYAELVRLGPTKLDQIRHNLASHDGKFLKLEQLSEFLGDSLNEEDALRLASIAISLRRLADRVQASVDEVLDALTNGLLEYGWDKDKSASWSQVLVPLRGIVNDPKIELVVKTSDLYFKHQFHIHEARIITDIRPVLNDKRSEIEVAIVKNTFMIEYSDGNELDKYLQLNLSFEDLLRLRNELDRAVNKTELIQRLIETNMKLPTIIYSSDW